MAFAQYDAQMLLPLKGNIADPISEISAMDWYKDELILVPQFPSTGPFLKAPDRSSSRKHLDEAYLYAITRQQIKDLFAGKRKVLEPKRIPFRFPESVNKFMQYDDFEGFEAIAFDGDHIYMTVEMERSAYLVKGFVRKRGGMYSFDMNPKIIETVKLQTKIDNMAEEALTINNNHVLSFHEVNSKMGNPKPIVQAFNNSLQLKKEYEFENLNYRITDATNIDIHNRFWVLNFMYYKDNKKIGPQKRVERLVEFEISGDRIFATKKQVSIKFLQEQSYNWEGLVRFGDKGFLVINDKFPKSAGTTLLFVPNKPEKLDD
jgi:hypothetical protein